MPFKYGSPIERILANSVTDEDHVYDGTFCWRWLRGYKKSRRGRLYPYICVRVRGKVRKLTVHRFIITRIKGRRLSKRQVGMHMCNNEWCVNIGHIVGGTQKKNVQQCVQQQRHYSGWHAYNEGRRRHDHHV